MHKLITLILLLPLFIQAKPQSFSQAKNTLKGLYKDHPTTFYCECKIEWKTSKKLVPAISDCGYQPRKPTTKKGKPNQRASRIEWEHVIPAWEFGHQMQCWQNGGRKACKKDPKFRAMEGDLHNLVPAIGEINGDRSNYRFNLIAGEPRVYGACDAEVDFKQRIFEPAENVRGDIARTYFYFEEQYGLKISRKQKQLFTAWDKLDPVDTNECNIHLKKAKRQGNANPVLAEKCS